MPLVKLSINLTIYDNCDNSNNSNEYSEVIINTHNIF